MALWQGIFINKGLFYGLLEAFYKNSHLNEYVDGGGITPNWQRFT